MPRSEKSAKRPPAAPLTAALPQVVRERLAQIGRLADAQGVRAWAVGGCVRDTLLGRLPSEIDVAVEGDGAALALALAQDTGGTLTRHEQFGTASVVLGSAALKARGGRQVLPVARAADGAVTHVDFAMCRKETYDAPGAYPRVSPGTLDEDLTRRDFTINAMALQVQGRAFGALVDPRHGRDDLQARQLRALHPRSFLDDPSRILRGVRFAQRFGCVFEPQTQQWLASAIREGTLERLNRGRWRKELLLMLEEPRPLDCLRQLGRLLEEAAPRP